MRLIQSGSLQFTIDQQPYLQGFDPIVQLFLYKSRRAASSRRRTRTPASLFVTKANVKPYLTTKTRYHGSSNKQKYPVTQVG